MKYCIAGLVVVAGVACAQDRPSFEVASIRPNNSSDARATFRMGTPGRFGATNVTLRRLIQVAYDIKDFQLSGGPGWIGADRFDINAEGAPTPNSDQVLLMLQSLLADRFKLITRKETKEIQMYALVVAKNGPKIKNAADLNEGGGGGARPGAVTIRRGLLLARAAQLTALLNPLSNILGRPVVDRTGMTGVYDLKLEWAPDEIQGAMFRQMGVPEGFGAPPPDFQGPSLFAALEEQLGLKLESQKGQGEILVIEHAERPTEN